MYFSRIQRGGGFYWRTLGAYGANLAALSGFFEKLWEPVADLSDYSKGSLLNWTGVDLMALGRLPEAAQLMQAGLDTAIATENWKGASISASNLSQLHLTT